MLELNKTYEAKQYEDQICKIWEESGFFNPDNLKGKPFTISMPPPNATGILHVGHASGLTYEDLIIRYKRLQGYKTLWLPGTDHAAIATQAKVEKLLADKGLDRHKLGRAKFLKEVKDYVAKSQQTIKNQIRKMGCSCDWSREKYTLDLTEAVNEAFVRMYHDGLIYRGNRIVNWCPGCASTLADDEVEYREQNSKLYYLKYGPFVVATTRPETKLADTGVAIHPSDKRYKKYIGQTLTIDLAGHKLEVKVFADQEVDQDFGSGVIGVTPAHSVIDFNFAQKHKLKVVKLINEAGQLLETGGKYKGLSVLEARKQFIIDLKKAKQLIKEEDYNNNLSVCYRCSTPIEPLTSEQWFVAVDQKIPQRNKTLKQLATEAVKKGEIKILPKRFEKVYFHWMNNLHDWCISRQIWWGHRIPVWYKGEEIYVGLNKPQGTSWQQDPDTLDTWFSSGLWTFSTLGWPKLTKDLKQFHPTTVLETAPDILFFWVARMILMTEYFLKEKPFETVYLHGLVRDKQGRKMSKSLDNGIDPLEMIKKFGTDALRLSLIIGSAPGADLRIYEEKIASYRNFVNKLWNISRFILTTVKKVKTVDKVKSTTLADQWILAEFNKLIKDVTEYLEDYKFSQAGEILYEFTWSKLADWYLEISKLEKNKDDILLYILERLLILWHPFTPFVTEVIYQQFKTKQLLMINHWPKYSKVNEAVIKDFTELQNVVVKLRNLKAENKINPKDLPDCYLTSSLLNQNDLNVVAKLARVNLVTTLVKAKSFKVGQTQGKINLVKAISSKEKQSLTQYIKSLESKLSNQQFLANAPAKVIKQTKENLIVAKNKLK